MHPIDRMAECGERPLSLPEAFREVLGYAPSPATAWRWVAKGVTVGGTDGKHTAERVHLWAFRAGRRKLTTAKAVREFIAKANPQAESSATQACRRAARDLEADRRLRDEGVLADEVNSVRPRPVPNTTESRDPV